jgi:hypothetical protein
MFFNSTVLDFPVILGVQFSSLSNHREDIFEVKYLTSMIFQCEISGSHGGEHEDESLLGYSAL